MNTQERLEIVLKIAEQAGEIISKARQANAFKQDYKGGDELVTEVDIEVDRFIANALEEAFLGETRLSEELAPDYTNLPTQGPLWVVDPIDGTVNFAYGHRHVAVSIAWVEDGKTQIGVVHSPFLQETFTSIRGEGAKLNGQSIACSKVENLERTLVATGFPYSREGRAPLINRLSFVLDHCRDIRRNGSAALDLCHVACGQLDAYYESVNPWDFAAGLLIAREAGANTGHLNPCPSDIPEELYGVDIIVAPESIYQDLKTVLTQADAHFSN